MTKEEIRKGYDEFAPWFDLAESPSEFLGVRKLRQRLLEPAAGEVLELGVGTGKNLPHYPRSVRITAVDLSPRMLELARKRARRLGLDVTIAVMDAEELPFPAHRFDTVVDTLNLCTYPDPLRALREMVRVCRPNGRILLLEHGRSSRPWLGRWQDRRAAAHAKRLGCRWNREPLEFVRQAGLRVVEAERFFFGIFHCIAAAAPSERIGDSARGGDSRGRES